jgi:glycosyltransferase involved in cell wall biosynthesis
MTVQNKIYQAIAMKKPLISGDSPAIQSTFKHREHVYLCERANPASLADTILTLKADPQLCERLAYNGYEIFKECFSVSKLGELYRKHLLSIIKA